MGTTINTVHVEILAHFSQMWMSVRKDWMTVGLRWPVTLPQLAERCAEQWLRVSTPMAATGAHVPLAILETGETVLVSHQFLHCQIALVFTLFSEFKEDV